MVYKKEDEEKKKKKKKMEIEEKNKKRKHRYKRMCSIRGKKIKIIYYIILNRKNNLENFSCRPTVHGEDKVCGGGGGGDDVNFSQPGKVFTV